jgi:hypothetical protein
LKVWVWGIDEGRHAISSQDQNLDLQLQAFDAAGCERVFKHMDDDDFGHWEDMDDEDNHRFYEMVQRESVWKKCERCGRRVKLRPRYGVCNSGADKLERRFDL